MAVQDYTTTTRRAPFLEAAQENYIDLLTQQVGRAPGTDGVPTLAELGPQVASQNVLTQAAQQAAATQAGLGQLTFGTEGQLTGVGTGTGVAGFQPFLDQAAAYSGPQAFQAFMSPYQQQVIDTTLAEFDRQRQIQQQAISDAAVAAGGYGGGREGVMQAEYTAQSGRDRAALEAQLQQQGFTQAQAARQADLASRLGIGGAQQQYAQGLAGMAGARAGLAGQQAALAQGQLGLGGALQSLAQSQLGAGQAYLAPGQMMAGIAGQQAGMAGQRAALAQQQLGAAGALQGFQGTDIARAGQVGAMDQAYAQAVMDAQREKARMGLYEPMERLGWLGQGLTGLMGGMGPQYQFATQPNPSPLATALGIGSTLGGIYGNVMGTGK